MGSDKNGFLTGETCQTNRTSQGFRKETEIFRRRLRGLLMKKGCKEGGVSL
ncbi:MAG: glycine cleavage system protein T [Capnocytophaga sp.]|nr:glycine cleavage system protein T [Capnocytophaga sp.]MDU6659837.1 glycine cleavage system protein T [Capnocytophaga sp.]